MKKLLPLIIFLCNSNIFGQVDTRPLITVTGTAQISVPPDHVEISLGVTNVDMNIDKAKNDNDKTMSKVLALVVENGIGSKDASTTYTSIEKKYVFIRKKDERIVDEDGDEIGTKVFKGFEVSKTLRITLRDLSKFQSLFDKIVSSGVTEINSVSFETSNIIALKKQARRNAMKAAHEKAVDMTSVVGQKVGKAVMIKEGGNTSSVYLSGVNANSQMSVGNFAKNESVATFALGSINVTSKVTVVFLIE